MNYIFAMGLYRSGTNFLQQLLDKNFKYNSAVIEKYTIEGKLYKHCLHDSWYNKMPNDVVPVIIYKDPFKWIDSLYRKSYDLELFYDVHYETGHTEIYLPFEDPDNEGYIAEVRCSVQKLCRLYNRYFTYWSNKNVEMVSHKKIICETENCLSYFQNKYSLQRINENFTMLEIDEVDGSRPFTQQVKLYYDTNEIENLNDVQIKTIKSTIDVRLKEF
jgi:hypothetical protein